MRWIIRWGLGILVCALVAASATNARGSDPPGWQSRTDLETHARQLDHRLMELQHAIMAARQKGDPDALARAEAELKNVQAERVEALRARKEDQIVALVTSLAALSKDQLREAQARLVDRYPDPTKRRLAAILIETFMKVGDSREERFKALEELMSK